MLFRSMPQFSAEARYFSSLVIAPLLDSGGPLPGAVQALSQVMESVMIRHRYVNIVSCLRADSILSAIFVESRM